MWGLAAFHRATGDRQAAAGARRAAEFLLRHRLFRSEGSGEVISQRYLRIRYPPYYHYDILAGLRMLALCGAIDDPRASEALVILASKRRADGTWHADGTWWRTGTAGNEVVDWGRRGPNEFVTLQALLALRSAGRE